MLVEILLGLLKKYKDIGLTSYQNCRISTCHNLAVFQHFKRTMFLSPKTHLTPVEILGYFLRTRLFAPKYHCLCGLSTSWAAFKEYRDIGPKTYPNPSFNICQNLGLFHNNDDFWRQKPMAYFASKIFRFLKRTEILGPQCIKVSGERPVKILGYFIRTIFLMSISSWSTFANLNLFLKSAKILGLHCSKIPGLTHCRNHAVFHKNHVFDFKKTHGLFCLSHSWDF